jgi:hypothetical protein
MAKRQTTPDQQAALDQLREVIPADAVPGFSVSTTGTEKDAQNWFAKMRRVSNDLALNAYAYSNYQVKRGKLLRSNKRVRRVISAEGFPANINITYAAPPPLAYFTPNVERKITHFVLHSFGHVWNATVQEGVPMGWMNSTKPGRGVEAVKYEGRTVFIPRGSDPKTLTHFTRFAAGLQTCLSSAAKATAHFFIDRAGNLVIIGDCNDILFTSNCMNNVSCGVELEEAFYVLKDTKGKGNHAIWRAGGTPPGTAGNIQYFTYSAEQLLTLAILVKKLETAYPALRQRNLSFDRKSLRPDAPPGYTMHDFIFPGIDKTTGAVKAGHIDVSPHFLSTSFWDTFFKIVDAQTHINLNNVFLPASKYMLSGDLARIDTTNMYSLPGVAKQAVQEVLITESALDRSDTIANATKATVNTFAANAAANTSKATSNQVAVTTSVIYQNKIKASDYMNEFIGVGVDGRQLGTDDFV